LYWYANVEIDNCDNKMIVAMILMIFFIGLGPFCFKIYKKIYKWSEL